MGKKGKVNKLAKMSDEERARYLQHRADLEEEARRRKRELIARFIKNKLDKEEAYSRKNTAKINQQWRFILRKIKCKQMAQEIEAMRNSFNFLVDRKNRLLKSLTRALEDSDEQHRRAFQAHTETVSYFLCIGSQGLDKLQAEYEHQKNSLLENWDKEELDLTDNQEKAEFKLKLITYIQRRDFNKYKTEKELEIATAKNDARLEFEEDMRAFRRPKQLEIEVYWTKLREVFNTYIELHNPIINHYESLREKDDFYQRDIARNEIQIQQAEENLTNLQKEWNKMTANMNSKLTRMANHKELLTRKYWQLKKEAKTETQKADDKLAVMVNSSQDAITRLEKVKDKLDKVIQMTEICKKYEHPGDDSFIEIDDNLDSNDFDNLDGAMIEECNEYKKLDKFMLKMNRIKVQTMCLNNEKAKLVRENVELKQYIKRYLTDLALKSNRPASMRAQSEQEKTLDAKVYRPVTCIEGVLSNAVMHEKRMKTYYKKNKDNCIRAYPRVQCWM